MDRRSVNTRGGEIIRSMTRFSSAEAARREIESAIPEIFPRLWRYCLALCGRRDWADDLAQAACLRALEKASSFIPGTHADRWLFRIAHRLWLNELRAAKLRRGAGLAPVEELDLIDDSPSAEANIFAGEVFSAVMALPEAQRATVLLVYVEGYRYKEAAEILDIPIGTIMSRLAAARRKLGERFTSETMTDAGAKT